jgi:hypothetical protein
MGGTAVRNLEMFRKAVGTEAAKNVVILTTKWHQIDPATGDQRHAELAKFYRKILDDGATLQKLTGAQSPLSVVEHIIERFPRVDLKIQAELVAERRRIGRTSAGHLLQAEVNQRRKEIEDRRMHDSVLLIGHRGSLKSPGTNGTDEDATQVDSIATRRTEKHERELEEINAKQDVLDQDYEKAKKTLIGRRIVGLVDSVIRRIKVISRWYSFMSGNA